MNLNYVQNLYDIGAVIEGLACSLAARKNAVMAAKQGPVLIRNEFKAVKRRRNADARRDAAHAPVKLRQLRALRLALLRLSVA